MACPIRMGLDPTHQITEDDIHDFELPDEIGFKWKDLARVLGYIEAIIETIEKEKRNSNRECCIELLVRWLRRKGGDATAGKLAEALTRIELKNLADRLIKTNDQSQFEKTMITLREEGSKMSATIKELEKEGSKMSARIKELEEEVSKMRARNKELEEEGSKMSARNKELEEEGSKMSARIKELEEESNNFETKIRQMSEQLASLKEEGSKMSVRINELEEENLKLRVRNNELEDAMKQQGSWDLEDISGVLTDTDQAAKELRISERLKALNQQLNTYVTSPLEVPEVKQDQLKTPVKLDLLTRLSERLQELYSDIQIMVSEVCKCSEDLKRDFYDFAYHGLRAEHNELVHRVKDLESTVPEMCQEEKEDFERLQKYQVNRQRQVERLDKVWRGLFSPPERLPKTPWSDTTGISDKSKESKKVSRHTDPGSRPKQTKPRDVRSKEPPANCDDDKNEVSLNVTKGKSVIKFFRRKDNDEDACILDSCSVRRDS